MNGLLYLTINVAIIAQNIGNSIGHAELSETREQKIDRLNNITEIGRQFTNNNCLTQEATVTTPITLSAKQFDHRITEKVDYAARLLDNRETIETKDFINSMICAMVEQQRTIFMVNFFFKDNVISFDRTHLVYGKCKRIIKEGNMHSSVKRYKQLTADYGYHPKLNQSLGMFTHPYYHCKYRKWLISYMVNFSYTLTGSSKKEQGEIIVDIDLSHLNINQCDGSNTTDTRDTIGYFSGTHKCDKKSSYCRFMPGHGWTRGGYMCDCRNEFYSLSNKSFNGSYVEVTYGNWITGVTDSYEYLYKCLKCAPGCTKSCNSSRPCLAEYNWTLRIALLSISLMCIAFTLIIMVFVYQLRSLKVFKMASPTFLQICLVGCITMYLEMVAIFPILNMFYCIFTKWTRHLGFCLTFSALLMKTWRVSLTYRVKSAHKIKLTDKQLLQWMTPIILIMVIYLGSWTISDSPDGEDVSNANDLIFKQCTYNWWDHSIAIGEMIFLVWGSKVCFGVRKAESFFDEAKCIALAVYNITMVNVIMASFHVFFFPKAGPDLKYFFGFLRTQMSTSTTIGLVFGPKFFRVLKGRGNQLDTHTKARGITITVPVNGLGSISEGPPDPQEENEELKEEIQKMAAQMEFMKIVQMEMNNRHLKPKTGGYFSEKHYTGPSLGQSPQVLKGYHLKSELTEPSSPSGDMPSENV